jgi:hypothetical protein
MRSTLACLALVAACGTDPVTYSAPVGIELDAKSGHVLQDSLTELKDITTESGNPYGAFISAAMAKLRGKDPSRIEIHKMTLTLGAQSTGVTTLDQVFKDDVEVSFLVSSSNHTYAAGHVMNPTGAGPVTMSPTFEWSMVAAQDVPPFLNGSFKVVLSGTAATNFSGLGADAAMQVTFTFTAFQ